jgi:hypothetical protein
MIERRASASWPWLLTPAPGCLPLAATPRRTERVLHVALYPRADITNSLPRAFGTIATAYTQIDHVACLPFPGALTDQIVCEGGRINATLVFMQVQGACELTADYVARIRPVLAPNAVIVQWDGDMHWPPRSAHRDWFKQLGAVIDASLTAETQHQAEYAQLGVVRPGFLEAGADDHLFHPLPPTPGGPDVVFLANNWEVPGRYVMRKAIAAAMAAKYGDRFGVFGQNWGLNGSGHGNVHLTAEAAVYSSARAALSISIDNNIARYTSDRLIRMLCSGSLCLVERFPDCEGLGLVDGVNCLLWTTWAELQAHVDAILATPDSPRWPALRHAAAELGKLHTWDARMLELLAIVDAVRRAKGLTC